MRHCTLAVVLICVISLITATTTSFAKEAQEGRAFLKDPAGGNYLYVQKLLKQNKKVLNPDALVFSGGGASGVAYAGVLNYLEHSGKLNNVTRYMGASAGAIFSFLFYLGMTPQEVDKLYKKIDWKSFMDNRGAFNFFDFMKKLQKPHIELGDIWAPIVCIFGQWWQNWAIAPGNVIEKTMRQVLIDRGLSDDGHISFKDLKAKLAEVAGGKQLDLYVVAFSTCHYKTCIFSAERSPDMDVVTAIRASMSIPLVFDPVEVKDKDGNTDYLVDGGTTYNYPIEYMDEQGARPLGFLLGNKTDYTDPKYEPIETFGGFVGHIFWGLFDNIGPRMQGNLYRTVFIDTPTVGTLDFDMTPADRDAAVKAGYNATLKYFH